MFSRSTLNLAILSQVQTSLNPRSASAARVRNETLECFSIDNDKDQSRVASALSDFDESPSKSYFDNLDEQIKLGLVTLSDTSLESAAGKKFAFTRLNPKRAVSTEQGFAAKLPEDSYLRSSGRQASLKDICGRLGDEFTKQVAWKVDPNGADVLFGLVTVSEKGHENVKFGLSIRRLTSIAPDAVDTGEVSPSALTVGDDTEMSGM